MVVADIPEYMQDWDWERNTEQGVFPDTLTSGSRKRVFWSCHVCGGKWDTVMKERRGCPYCSNFKALPGYNDLATTHPDLAKQWSKLDNGTLTPQDVTSGSQKKVFWVCDKGHVWDAQINSRVSGQGCPYCNNRRVLKGYNDLATMRPDLAKEWYEEKNGALTPADVVFGSKKVVWWKCQNGHAWETAVIKRYRGAGCPVCANRMVMVHHNDLATEHPELLAEWDYERNERKPEDYPSGSTKSVWWICKRGHHWKTAIAYRCRGSKCPKCNEERQISFAEKAVYYYLKKLFPEMQANYRAEWTAPYELDMYLEKLKIAVEYDGVYGHSTPEGIARDLRKNKVCFENGVRLIRIREPKCPPTESTSIDYRMPKRDALEAAIRFTAGKIVEFLGIRQDTIPQIDVDIARDSGEIYSLIEFAEKENSLQTKAPHIARMWNQEKNGKLTPEYVSYMSSKYVWWIGACGHEWRSTVAYEVQSGLCPYCSGKRVLKGFNDLQSVNPTLAQEWDNDKNGLLKPYEITSGSGKKVWWKCDRGHSWQASIVSRNRGNGCPICANRIVLRGFNDVASVPELLQSWDYDKNELKPEDVCVGSEKKASWRCNICGYEWSAVISRRYSGQGCPNCAKQKRSISVAQTYVQRSGSILEKCPDLIEEWDWEKNTFLQPSQVTCGSMRKVWWVCKACGNRWETSIAVRCREAGSSCPRCADKLSAKRRQSLLLEKKGSIAVTHPELAREWCEERNANLLPKCVTAGSGKRVWWCCSKCGMEWQAQICERTRGKGKCPACNKRS